MRKYGREWLDFDWHGYSLTRRAVNVLENYGCKTTEDVAALGYEGLLQLPFCGVHTANLIWEVLFGEIPKKDRKKELDIIERFIRGVCIRNKFNEELFIRDLFARFAKKCS